MTSKWHKTVIAIFFLISSVTALAQDDEASLMTYDLATRAMNAAETYARNQEWKCDYPDHRPEQ